jgi:hypothetical protein
VEVILDVVAVEVEQAGQHEAAVGVDDGVCIGVDAPDRDDPVALDTDATVEDGLGRDDAPADDGDAFRGGLCGRTHPITTSPS